MKADYSKWRARLKGEKVPTYTEPDERDVGFYRLPIRERAQNAQGNNNGRWKTIGWKPIALFVANEAELVCEVGVFPHMTTMSPDQRNEQWHWFVAYPITEELWRAVVERGEPWPGLPAQEQNDSLPKAWLEAKAEIDAGWPEKGHNAEPEQPLDVQHATVIDNAIAAAVKTVKSEEDAAKALGSKNRIAELRLKADKAGKAIYEPMYREYTAEQKKWSPIVARATATEKALNTAILTYREAERKRIAAEQAEADRKQREIDEANQRAADRAIAAGMPEPAPVVEAAPMPQAPAPIVATYGSRKLKEELKKFVEIDDITAVFTRFKAEPSVVDLLTKLAQKEIDAGRPVPGTHTREGLI